MHRATDLAGEIIENVRHAAEMRGREYGIQRLALFPVLFAVRGEQAGAE